MQITSNTTPFLSEPFVATDKHGVKRCVVVVKATYDVDADGQARAASEQMPFVYADEHHGDPGTTAIRYESDFAPIKLHPEVLLQARAFAQGMRPTTMVEVALVGPGLGKRALVIGDRFWLTGRIGFIPSEPKPFLTMPLVWDRAFGGSEISDNVTGLSKNSSELRNLVGVGFHLNAAPKTVAGTPLPNIERRDSLVRAWTDKPEPIGFGPVGRGWRPRINFAGTYDQRWMDETLPFLPEDFDNRHYQAAPLDQQLSSIAPGSMFGCYNMCSGGRFVAQIPQTDIPIRFYFDERVEMSLMNPDTLLLEPELGRLALVGRVSVVLPRKHAALREIQVGRPKRAMSSAKHRFNGLANAIAALRLAC